MRLLIVSSEFPPGPGGIGTHAFELARQLADLGWRLAVVTQQDYVSIEDAEQFNAAQPFPVLRLEPLTDPLQEGRYRWRAISDYVRRFTPNVVMATGERMVWLSALVAARHRIPWIAIGHGTEFGPREGWRKRLSRWSFGRADAVVCVSEYTWKQMHAMGVRPRVERIIPNGADPAKFRLLPDEEVEEFRSGLGLPSGSRLLMTVGNVTRRKAQDVVIRALPRILEQAPNTHYLMIGLPTLQEDMQRLAGQLGVEEHVHFLGRLENSVLLHFLNCCDVFVMTSRNTADGDFEGYGIAVVEAALCGKPAVVAGNSGLMEAVQDGVTGLVVPQDDAGQTADAILALLQDDVMRGRMGQAARMRALSEQTWSKRARKYDEVLRSVVPFSREQTDRMFMEAKTPRKWS